MVPGILESAEIVFNYLCIAQPTEYATDVVKRQRETLVGSTEFFNQINQETSVLMRDVVEYALMARRYRIAKQDGQ